MLPQIPMPAGSVTIGDVDVAVRGLSLAQVRQLREMEPDASDAQAIAWGVGCEVAEATEWLATAPAGASVEIMAEIMRLSGWDEGARKS